MRKTDRLEQHFVCIPTVYYILYITLYYTTKNTLCTVQKCSVVSPCYNIVYGTYIFMLFGYGKGNECMSKTNLNKETFLKSKHNIRKEDIWGQSKNRIYLYTKTKHFWDLLDGCPIHIVYVYNCTYRNIFVYRRRMIYSFCELINFNNFVLSTKFILT